MMNLENYQLQNSGKLGLISLIIGIVALVISAIGIFVDSAQFFHSYLTSVVYWISISLGGLFLILIHYLTGATWTVALRRIIENIMAVLPVMALFFIPILVFGLDDLFHWSNPDAVAHDHLLQEKSPYLNAPFFIIRTAIYFVIWIWLSMSFLKKSLAQDNADGITEVNGARKMSTYGVILFAVTVSFAGFDWLMSLDAHWYSTIFGVYFFSGCVVGVYSLLIVTVMFLRGKGILVREINENHYHDLGRLLFTFVVFWSYIAFSQYFLIWYANIPEETIFYAHRWIGSWKAVSVLLGVGHFLIPFLILMIRAIKRNYLSLVIMAAWMLVMHVVDIYWLVLPNLHHHGVHLSWMDLTTFIGVGGVFLWMFWRNMGANKLIPINDPRLEKSINLIN